MSGVHTEKSGGARFYVSNDNPEISVPGVTSVLGMLPKPFLAPWNAKMTAELAADAIQGEYLFKMVERDRKGAVDWMKNAARRYTGERQEIGSEAHTLFELLMNGEEIGDVPERMEPYVKHFREFIDTVKPELVSAEDVAWSDEHGYAGSYDAEMIVRYNPETGTFGDGEPMRLLVDYKTGKSTYSDVALQLNAYAYADRIISPEGVSRSMPEFDGGAVLHVTETQWAFKPVRLSDELHATFVECLRFFKVVRDWEGEGWGRNRIPGLSDDVIGKPIAKNARRMQTGTERRAR